MSQRREPPMDQATVGFIGFGEAGFEIAKGLRAAGVRGLFFCHLRRNDPERSALARKRGRESEATLLESVRDVVQKADIILSVVPPHAATIVAAEATPHLAAGKVYVDLTSSFPDEMKALGDQVEVKGADFVDGAITGALPMDHHRVLIFAAGKKAARTAKILNGYGMNLVVVGTEPGQASAIKIILSIATKGFEALLVEMLLAAHPYGVEDSVLMGLHQFFDRGLDAVVDRFVGSDAIHAPRRVKEMESSLRLLEKLRIEPLMTRATVERLRWSASLGLAEKFGGIPPRKYQEVVQAWEELGLFAGKGGLK